MHIARRSLPLIATALLAALFLARGILHPELNYDVIAYVTLAKEMRGDGGKVEAYRELASKVGTSRFQEYVSGSYRERMYRDDGFFQANLRRYSIRPFYIALCSMVGSLVHSDVAATYLISAVSASLAVLLSYVIAGIAGLVGNWRLAIPVIWIAAAGLNLAGLSTPDALETLITLIFVLTSAAGPWKGVRVACLLLLAVLMVTTRTDALLLVTFLMLAEWLLQPRHRLISTLVLAAALVSYLVVQKLSGSYADLESLSFLVERSHDVAPNLVPDLHGYVLILIHQILQTLGESFEYVLMLPAVSLLAIAWCRERRISAAREADGFNKRALILSAALAVYIIVRFVLFPAPAPRYLTNAYVLAGILFARAIQPIALTQPDSKPKSPNENAAGKATLS